MSNENVQPFDRDASALGGYVYTSSDRLSCRLATQRSTDIILSAGVFRGKRVLDMGCGDGFYTRRFWDQGRPKTLTAVDAAPAAIEVARKRSEGLLIRFQVADAHRLPFANNSFDVALVQSILHHDDQPGDLIREAFRVAPTILIHEPNGNNAGLKVIERLSRYHRDHGEKSYSSPRIRTWIRQAGGEVHWEKFAGFVPMFSPDWLARGMKALEPLLERCPGARSLGCALYVVVARRAAVESRGIDQPGEPG